MTIEEAFKAGWNSGYYDGGEHDCRMFTPTADRAWKEFRAWKEVKSTPSGAGTIRERLLVAARAYFDKGRCSGHHQFNGRYCRDVAEPDRWCIHCAGFMLMSALSLDGSEAQGWQPIETAPKDGTRVLLLVGTTVLIGQWDEEANAARFQRYPAWQIFDCEDGFYSWAEPTADGWMPLPPPSHR